MEWCGWEPRQERSSLETRQFQTCSPQGRAGGNCCCFEPPHPPPQFVVSVMCGFLWSGIAPNRASFPGAAIAPVGPSFRLSDVFTFPSIPDQGLGAGPGDEGVPGPPGFWFLSWVGLFRGAVGGPGASGAEPGLLFSVFQPSSAASTGSGTVNCSHGLGETEAREGACQERVSKQMCVLLGDLGPGAWVLTLKVVVAATAAAHICWGAFVGQKQGLFCK